MRLGTPCPADDIGRAAPHDRDGDEPARVRLAARTTAASLLRELASDPSVTVRAAVAMNAAYAPAADQRLVADDDERVRLLLAGKIATLLPGLSEEDQAAAQAHVNRTLASLAKDAAVRVRIAVAEAVAIMPGIPRDLVLTLARDPSVMVSVPVIRLSPLLTDTDLLDLLATPAHEETARAVAGRNALSAQVSHRIAEQANSAAIQTLLLNETATIQEATLDALIGRAGDHPEWHEPLVCRPKLPTRSARALSKLVARHLVLTLVCRADLAPDLADELRERLAANLDDPAPVSDAELIDKLQRVHAVGGLTELALFEALDAGDTTKAAAMLSIKSGVTPLQLSRAIALRSAKGLVSIVWKAGFTMRAAAAVQTTLAHLAPHEQLAAAAHAAFPLSPQDMDWQIELLDDPAR